MNSDIQFYANAAYDFVCKRYVVKAAHVREIYYCNHNLKIEIQHSIIFCLLKHIL